MQVHEVTISDVKRVKFVNFKPQSNKLTIIGGKNGQGKSSSLHAIAYALGGEAFKPSNLTRDGATEYPYIKVEMDNGLVLERKGKNSDLHITDPTGQLGGQAILNKVLTKLALNLSEFINMGDKEKAKYLLQIIGCGDQLELLEREEDALYDERHILGITKDRKKKAALEMPHYMDVGEEPMTPTDLLNKQKAIMERNAVVQAAKSKFEANKTKLTQLQQSILRMSDHKDALNKQIEQIKEQIALTDEQMKGIADQMNAVSKDIEDSKNQNFELESLAEVEKELQNFAEINRKIDANRRQRECMEEADALELKYKEFDAKINDVRNRKQELLNRANLPYPGLSVQKGVLTLDGKNWDCMSGSQQMTVACAIISRLKPDCRFILVDKLEQYDEEQLAGLDKWCEENEFQIIGTRVSVGDENSLIIEDGLVVGAEPVEVKPVVRKTAKTIQKTSVASLTPEIKSAMGTANVNPVGDGQLSPEEIAKAERLAKMMHA